MATRVDFYGGLSAENDVVADQTGPETPGGTPSRAQKRPAQDPTGETPENSKPKAEEKGWGPGDWYQGNLGEDDREFDVRKHYHLLEEEEEECDMPGGQGVGPKPNKRAKEQFEDKQAAKASARRKEKDNSIEVKINAWSDERGGVVDLKAAEWDAVKEDFMAYVLQDDKLACAITKDFYNNPARSVSYGGFRLSSEWAADKLVKVFMKQPFGPVQLKVARQYERESFIQIAITGNQGWRCMTDRIGEQIVRVNGLKGMAKSTEAREDKAVRGGWLLRIYPDEELRISIENYSTNKSELQVGYKKYTFDFITLGSG